MSKGKSDDVSLSPRRKHGGRPFAKGFDPRRHKFTREECRRAGLISWARTMAETRMSMELPLPLPELREWARCWAREWLARHRAEPSACV